jgi:hypothetical protein
MENFNVLVKNGVTLPAPQRVALDTNKIVWFKAADGSRTPSARILYCRNFDRQEPCDDLILQETLEEAGAVIVGEGNPFGVLFNPYTVFVGNNPDNYSATEALYINDWFIAEAYATKVLYQDVLVPDAVAIKFTEGSFHRQTVYAVPGSISGLVTTTTEELASTTSGGQN